MKQNFDDSDFIVRIPRSKKPRAKELNEALMTRPAGKMKSAKDNSRMKQKQELARMLEDSDE